MWNKLVETLQTPASKRLGFAIVVSALLHTLFFGNIDFSLPNFKQEMHSIEARIQMPRVVPRSIAEPVIAPEVIAPKVTAPEGEKLAETALALPISDAVVDVAPKVEPSAPESVDNVDPIPLQEPTQPEDIGLVINESAYQYIETEFDVRTQIDGSAEGKATISYDVIENMQYRIRWLTKGTGVMALLYPELLQTSDGEVTKSGLQPNNYLYQFGSKVDKMRSANFDWQSKKVNLQTAKGSKTEDLPEGTQDLLSFMYQFMHVPPLQHMQVPIVNGKKLRIYDYSFEGEEQVNSALGELKTIHILHSGSTEEEKTELWLAIDYQYVPIKIRKIDSDGSVVEMLATRISTNRTVIDQ